MRNLFLSASIAVGVFAGSAAAQSVGGAYTVSGTNFDGSPYGGTATIAPSGSACVIEWKTPSTSDGICMLAGKSFAAAYKMGNDVGLVVYELQPDGKLIGVWTIAGKDGAGKETLTPKR